MIKIIDRLVIRSFVGPFVVTFAIAIFFFLMQTLWFYIDDIVGKGLGFFFIIELLGYKCVSLIPMALPLAILISSVMVLGNMAEHYELSSIKSAGVPLLRVMRPLILFGVLSSLLSYYCSATLIPLANLKFGSRMYDVQQQKPSLRLEEGIFNDDFQGFSIHIGKKEPDGRTIRNVLIYDHSEAAKGQYSQISATTGEMYTSNDGRYFVMNLLDGSQYIEINPSSSQNTKYPFVRTSFKKWTKIFDMSEFEINRTNEELFKSNRTMMSIPQLAETIDSMTLRIAERRASLGSQMHTYITVLRSDNEPTSEPIETTPLSETAATNVNLNLSPGTTDSIVITTPPVDATASTPPDSVPPPTVPQKITPHSNPYSRPTTDGPLVDPQSGQPISEAYVKDVEAALARRRLRQLPESTLPEVPAVANDSINYLDTLLVFADIFPQPERLAHYDRARTFALSILNQAESNQRSLKSMLETRVKFTYEMWTKYSIALVCIIFVFIGAPMGAIVRKGGFGYPILISIIFFMIFVILTIFCRKIAEAFVLPAIAAAWVPAVVLFPIGLVLTFKAMNDSNLQLSEGLTRIRERIIKKIKNTNPKANPEMMPS